MIQEITIFFNDWQITFYLIITNKMFFLFLTTKIKYNNKIFNIANWQNVYNVVITINVVVELYKLMFHKEKFNWKIFIFSISHNYWTVYNHYILINEKNFFYRRLFRNFSIINQNNKNKWIVYKFTRNIYDTFVLIHFEKICNVVDQLFDLKNFDVKFFSQ